MTTIVRLGYGAVGMAERLDAAESLPPPEERRRIREDAKVSRAELARALNVMPVTVKRWETGEREPQFRNKVAYGELLAVLRNRPQK